MAKNESGLMSKKKAELIDIILRKDDVEKDLRLELDATKLDFEKAKKMADDYQNQLKAAKSAYEESEKSVAAHQDIIDDLVTEHACETSTIKKYKRWTLVLGIALVISIILGIIF